MFKNVLFAILGVLTPILAIALVIGIFYLGWNYRNKISWKSWKKALWNTILLLLVVVVGWQLLFVGNKKTTKQPVVSSQVYTYNFSKEKGPKKFTVKFYQNEWVGVSLPVGVWFRTDVDSDANVVFLADRASFIIGPDKQTSYGDGINRTIFRVKGLERSGTMVIYIEPKGRIGNATKNLIIHNPLGKL